MISMSTPTPRIAGQQAKPILQKPPGYRDPNGPQARPRPIGPPRKPPIPPSFPAKRRRKSCCRVCCCCFCFFIVLLIILIVIAGALFYLWFDPKLPVFHLQSFSFRHFNVSVKSDGTYLHAATLTRVEARNPNGKLRYYYGHTDVEVTAGKDKEIDLGTGSVPGFTQGTKNARSLKIETKTDELVEDGMGPRLMSHHKSKDLVVNVVVKTTVAVIVQGRKTRPLAVKVTCGGQSLKALNKIPKCTIHFLKW